MRRTSLLIGVSVGILSLGTLSWLHLRRGAAPRGRSSPRAPAAPVSPHGFRAPTLSCTALVPAGWSDSRPMPDHIKEIVEPLPPPGGRQLSDIIIREFDDAPLSAALATLKQRTQASWGAQPDFALVDESVLEGATPGRLLRYVWRIAPAGAMVVEYLALYEVGGRIVEAIGRTEAKAAPASGRTIAGLHESEILATLRSLRCGPR